MNKQINITYISLYKQRNTYDRTYLMRSICFFFQDGVLLCSSNWPHPLPVCFERWDCKAYSITAAVLYSWIQRRSASTLVLRGKTGLAVSISTNSISYSRSSVWTLNKKKKMKNLCLINSLLTSQFYVTQSESPSICKDHHLTCFTCSQTPLR